MSQAITTALPVCPVAAFVGTNTPLASNHTFWFRNDSAVEVYVTFHATLRDSLGHTVAEYKQQGQLVVGGEVREYLHPLAVGFAYTVPGVVALIAESYISDFLSGFVYHGSASSCQFRVS
ncbi:hypothetical protein SAMN02745121_06103 [Nannocystis exedens]|uniref:Uncharacterized protein n=1 Tax=Nannocystis exedens TaxID=54 RepID=A0A1I2EL43_9BACT|nr:hypothetical protein [Nannocystis exedens]PCC73976.1 hypothetical protein NAEX_07065 [Nannocystis exedens]SFE93337.1 hypothetical protein SAMN02745121_06103 [Nannocystis exedens]